MELSTYAFRETLAALKKKRMELTLALEKVEKAIAALSELEHTVDPVRRRDGVREDPTLVGLSIPDAAARILGILDKPTHFYEIIAELQSRGYRSEQDPESFRLSLVSALARKARARDTFVSKGRGMYALRDREESGAEDQNRRLASATEHDNSPNESAAIEENSSVAADDVSGGGPE